MYPTMVAVANKRWGVSWLMNLKAESLSFVYTFRYDIWGEFAKF